MEPSILKSTKQILGIPDDDSGFDLEILTHINTALSTLNQMGVGPSLGLQVEDENPKWSDFVPEGKLVLRNMCKDFVYLSVRQVFDPPNTSYLVKAQQDQIEQLGWRINTEREHTDWVDSNPPPPVEEVLP